MATNRFYEECFRRDFLKLSAAGVGFVGSSSGWLDQLAARAAAGGTKHKSCILLWMDGGPPQTDMFDMKPNSPGKGVLSPINTSVPGIQICEGLPKFAKQLQHAAVIRSMSTVESEHQRARYHMHTGTRQTAGTQYPSLGATASSILGNADASLPNYVHIGSGHTNGISSGFLGKQHEGLRIVEPEKGVENLKALVDDRQMDGQLDLLKGLEQDFAKERGSSAAAAHVITVQRAVRMMQSKEAKAFDLNLEPTASRKAYNNYGVKHPFGDGCLLARRLIEVGVPFVEVNWHGGGGGWDLHQDCNKKLKEKLPVLDTAMTRLVTDLKDRGLLDSTLIVWMGEFGRTPLLKGGGRDHYARAWTTMLIGGGVKGGQVIGKTDTNGAEVTERPVSAADYLATICLLLGIDYTKHHQTQPNGRPVALVDKDAGTRKAPMPITELL